MVQINPHINFSGNAVTTVPETAMYSALGSIKAVGNRKEKADIYVGSLIHFGLL